MEEVTSTQETVVESTETQTETASEWSYADGVPGNGDAPEYFKSDKYKTLADQAKAYTDLEKKFGSFTGAPEEYALNEDLQANKDNPLFTKFAESNTA